MPINVLVVDDNSISRQILSAIVETAPDMRIVGHATNGIEAVHMVESLKPDIILMDVVMPDMDGLEATRVIMDIKPTPIVIISGTPKSDEANIAFDAISAGALSVLQKPGAPGSPSYRASIKEILDTLRAMSGVRVIRHRKSQFFQKSAETSAARPAKQDLCVEPEIVCIAASTGGPQTIGEIVRSLPATFNLPIVIVQHITPDFVSSFVDWLNTVSCLPVRIAEAGEQPLRGTVYIAPGSKHLRLTGDYHFEFSDTPANVPHIPSGDVLLASIAERFGSRAIGIVLTGMGSDGAYGLRAMYQAGAMTIAQDEASCVVFGMPQEAIALGAARQTLSPAEITSMLIQYIA